MPGEKPQPVSTNSAVAADAPQLRRRIVRQPADVQQRLGASDRVGLALTNVLWVELMPSPHKVLALPDKSFCTRDLAEWAPTRAMLPLVVPSLVVRSTPPIRKDRPSCCEKLVQGLEWLFGVQPETGLQPLLLGLADVAARRRRPPMQASRIAVFVTNQAQ